MSTRLCPLFPFFLDPVWGFGLKSVKRDMRMKGWGFLTSRKRRGAKSDHVCRRFSSSSSCSVLSRRVNVLSSLGVELFVLAWAGSSWLVLQLWGASVCCSCVLCPRSLQTPSSSKPELLLESFPAGADSGLEAAPLPKSTKKREKKKTKIALTSISAVLLLIQLGSRFNTKCIFISARRKLTGQAETLLNETFFYLASFFLQKIYKKNKQTNRKHQRITCTVLNLHTFRKKRK